jgi:hypothetical protein
LELIQLKLSLINLQEEVKDLVEMPNDDEAQTIDELNGATVQGRNCSKQI